MPVSNISYNNTHDTENILVENALLQLKALLANQTNIHREHHSPLQDEVSIFSILIADQQTSLGVGPFELAER